MTTHHLRRQQQHTTLASSYTSPYLYQQQKTEIVVEIQPPHLDLCVVCVAGHEAVVQQAPVGTVQCTSCTVRGGIGQGQQQNVHGMLQAYTPRHLYTRSKLLLWLLIRRQLHSEARDATDSFLYSLMPVSVCICTYASEEYMLPGAEPADESTAV